jgi:hypothetical protein
MAAADLGGSLPLVFSINDIHRYAANFLGSLKQRGLTSWSAFENVSCPCIRLGETNDYLEQHRLSRPGRSSMNYAIYHTQRGHFAPIILLYDCNERSAEFTIRASDVLPGYDKIVNYPGGNTVGIRVLSKVKMRHILGEFKRLQEV